MDQILILLLIGAFGGLIRSILGFKNQSDDGESFNIIKTLKSVIRASLAGSMTIMTISNLTNTEITTATYMSAFLIAIGTDVITKEGYSSTKEILIK